MKRVLRLASALALLAIAVGAEQEKSPASYHGNLSSLGISGGALQSDWTGPTGLVVDSFNQLDQFPPAIRPTVEQLKKQLAPLGVVGTADFTYRRKSKPLEQITLRVFQFDSEKSCADWWEKKYRHPGWEKFYKPVEGVLYKAVDSTELPKRAVAFGNMWMTCGSTRKTDDHLELLDLFIRRLDDPAGPDQPGRRRDKSGDFSYELPKDSRALAVTAVPHDIVMLPEVGGLKRNVFISDQAPGSSLEELKTKYEEAFPKAFRNFKLLESELVKLPSGEPAVRLVHTNTNPGIPVRQVNYLVDVGAKRYFVVGTVPIGDGDKFDAQFEAFVTSMQAVD